MGPVGLGWEALQAVVENAEWACKSFNKQSSLPSLSCVCLLVVRELQEPKSPLSLLLLEGEQLLLADTCASILLLTLPLIGTGSCDRWTVLILVARHWLADGSFSGGGRSGVQLPKSLLIEGMQLLVGKKDFELLSKVR